MKPNRLTIALAASLALALSPLTLSAGDQAKPEEKGAKDHLYTAACPSPCDFCIESHDKAEVAAILKEHAKTHHHMDMSDKDAQDMVKTKDGKKG